MEDVINVTDEAFEQAVLKSDKPVLVDFWATWCMPCRMQGEVLKEVEPLYAGKVRFAKVNVDENEKTAYAYRISSIPTLMVFVGGEFKEKLVGLTEKDELCSLLDKYVG